MKTLQPAEADLVEMFADASAVPLGTPDELSPFADDFQVEFVSNVAEAERLSYRGLDGFVAGWRDWLEPTRATR